MIGDSMLPEIELQTTKDDLLSQGYIPFSKYELVNLLSNTTVSGDYEYIGHRRYKTYMSASGEMLGENDWGAQESGRWSVNELGHFSVEWDGYWEAWTALVFSVDETVKFYDIESGQWRTTFNSIVHGKQSLDVSINTI